MTTRHIVSTAALLAAAWAAPAQAGCGEAASYSEARRGGSLLAIQNGRVVCERYASGWSESRAHELASGTKSFAGVMAAAAVQDGFLTLDELAAGTLTEWRDDPRKSRITIRQILQLTDGLKREGIGRPPAYADAIAMPAVHEPGEFFSYGPVPFQVFGEIMRRKLAAAGTEESPLIYLQRRIFDPLGIEPASWRHGRDGNPHLPSGAALTAPDWARFGEFVLARGVWEGERLVDAAAFDEMFAGTRANPAYGLTWWLLADVPEAVYQDVPQLRRATDVDASDPNFPSDMVFAAGAGKQRLYVSWEENLVIVRQAGGIWRALRGRDSGYSDTEFWAAWRE